MTTFEVLAERGKRGPIASSLLAPVKVVASGNLAVGTTGVQWHDLDPAGSATARPLDVVIPGCSVGQWICIMPDFYTTEVSAAYVNMDMFTIVGGVPINQFGPPIVAGSGGQSSWRLIQSTFSKAASAAWYQVKAGDIDETGAVRCRLRDYNFNSPTSRLIYGAPGFNLTLVGIGPF